MAQQLWGAEISVGAKSVVAPASTSLHISGAVLIAEAGTVANAFADVSFLLVAEADGTTITLASLSPSRPNAQLNLETARSGKITLAVQAVGAATGKYKVAVSGYSVGSAGKVAVAAAAPAAAQQKRKVEEAAKPASAKKQKVVESEDEEEEEDEAPATPKATKSAPASPAAAKKPAIVTLKNGLKLQDTKIGTGKEATDKSAVGIRYRGSLASNGKVFDSNMPRGQPLRFKIGGGDVIGGFEQGTKGMKVGGTRTVVIPSHLGYGARGAPPDIPGGATLVFDLELVSVK